MSTSALRNMAEAIELSSEANRHNELSRLHRRIAGLSTRLQRALRKEREHFGRLAGLEERLAKQKRALHELEVCRALEKETERLAEFALCTAGEALREAVARGRLLADWGAIVADIDTAMADLAVRQGPRP